MFLVGIEETSDLNFSPSSFESKGTEKWCVLVIRVLCSFLGMPGYWTQLTVNLKFRRSMTSVFIVKQVVVSNVGYEISKLREKIPL